MKFDNRFHIKSIHYGLVILGLGLLLNGCSALRCPSCSPLIKDIAAQNASEAEKRVRAREGIHQPDQQGDTPLHWASRTGQESIVAALLDAGASANVINHGGESPLYQTVLWGYLNTAKLLLDKGGDVNIKFPNGRTPLTYSCALGSFETALLLVQKGADVNLVDGQGFTPLIKAAQQQDTKIAELLLAKGADVNAFSAGQTPLIVAAEAKGLGMTKLLLEHGAKVNVADPDGYTALMAAARMGGKDVMEFLILRGAEVGARNRAGMTPLIYASYNGEKDSVSFLVERGANVNVETNVGLTPLYAAALGNHSGAMDVLIEAGAQPKSSTNSGEEAFASGVLFRAFGNYYRNKGDKDKAGASYAKAGEFFDSARIHYAGREEEAGSNLNKARAINVGSILLGAVMLNKTGFYSVSQSSTDNLKTRRDYLSGKSNESKENSLKYNSIAECLLSAKTMEQAQICPM